MITRMIIPFVLSWISGIVTVGSFWTTVIAGIMGLGFRVEGFRDILGVSVWVMIIAFILTILFFTWFILATGKSEKKVRKDIMGGYGE